MNRKSSILILATAVALVATGTLLVADSFNRIVGGSGRNRYVYSQSHNMPLYLKGKGCHDSYLPECGLVVW